MYIYIWFFLRLYLYNLIYLTEYCVKIKNIYIYAIFTCKALRCSNWMHLFDTLRNTQESARNLHSWAVALRRSSEDMVRFPGWKIAKIAKTREPANWPLKTQWSAKSHDPHPPLGGSAWLMDLRKGGESSASSRTPLQALQFQTVDLNRWLNPWIQVARSAHIWFPAPSRCGDTTCSLT